MKEALYVPISYISKSTHWQKLKGVKAWRAQLWILETVWEEGDKRSEKEVINGIKEAKQLTDSKMKNYLLMIVCMVISFIGLIHSVFLLEKFILYAAKIYSN